MPTLYDPFVRGQFAVGVQSAELIDRERANRLLPVEVWYPASAQYAGPSTRDTFTVLPEAPPSRQAAVRDAAVLAWRSPLILYSHSSNGHRRQATFQSTHLASHGYVVAAMDHTGNTALEAARRAATGRSLTPEERDAYIARRSLLIACRTYAFCWTSCSPAPPATSRSALMNSASA